LSLLKNVIKSFSVKEGMGIPIGNLTSQIFSNIYLNELDRFIKHNLKCASYLRYGDDFVVFDRDEASVEFIRIEATKFIENKLKLKLHTKNNFIIKTKHGVKFLGVVLYPTGRRLMNRNRLRIKKRLNLQNSGSYWGVISQHETSEKVKEFQWELLGNLYLI